MALKVYKVSVISFDLEESVAFSHLMNSSCRWCSEVI